MDEIKLPEGLAPEVQELFAKPEVMEAVKAIIQNTVQPLAENKKDILNQLAAQKQAIADLGGLDTIKTKMSAHAEAEARRLEAEQKADLASNDIEARTKALQAIIAQKDEELTTLKQEKVQGKVRSEVKKSVREAGGDYDLLEPFIAKRMKHEVLEDGKVAVRVYQEDGSPMLNAKGDYASINDLMTEYKNSPKYGIMFAADNKSGSGAKASSLPAASVDNPFMKGPSFNFTKQMELMNTQPAMAAMMAAQAGVKI